MKDFSIGVKYIARLVVWVAMLVSLSFPAMASDFKNYSFRTVTTFDGLSSNIINAIYKDERGFVWLGTQTGLDRFDGVSVITYPQFSGHTILSLVETDSIHLWIGTDMGLFRFDRKTEQAEAISLTGQPVRVNALYYDKPLKSLLVITDHGLFISRAGEMRQVLFGTNTFSLDNQLSGVAKGDGTEFWITSLESLIKYDVVTGNKEIYYTEVEGNRMSDTNRFSCLTLAEDKIYIGTRNAGISCFDRKTRTFSKFEGMRSGDIKQLMMEGKDTLYVGCNGNGIQVFNLSTGERITSMLHSAQADGICSSAVYTFLKEKDLFFVGTYMGGLSYTPARRNLFSVYSWKDVFHSSGLNVRTFYIDEEKENKVIGTRDGLYFLSEKQNRLARYTQRNSILRSDIILYIAPLGEDYLVGTYRGGLYLLSSDSGRLSFFGKENDFKNESFSAFAMDRKGNLWIGSSSGLYQYNLKDKQYRKFDSTNSSLSHSSIFSVRVDSSGRVWIGTAGALYMYNEQTGVFETDLFPEHLLPYTRSVRYIYEDRKSNLWFCDDKDGVLMADARFTRFRHYTTDDFLPNNSVMSIVDHPQRGGLWFATQGGLLYMDKDFALGKSFALYDGMPSYVFNNAVQITSDDMLWWGNERGLVSYHTPEHHTVDSSSLCPPAITSIIVAGELQKAGSALTPYASPYMEEISLPHSGSNIALTFSALNYAEKTTMLYEYCLEGYDKKWKTLSGKNSVAYTDLPSGSYVFKVRSSSVPDAVCALRITVESGYKNWGWMAGAVVVLCAVGLYYWKETRKVRLDNAEVSGEGGSHDLPKEKYQKSKIDDKAAAEIEKSLRRCMDKDKLYLNPDLKLQDMAMAIGRSAVEVSQTLNVFMNTNFTDFVNQYRVEIFIARVKQGDTAKFTLASLSEECGFSSRTSFFRSFRKLKGMSPSEYLKSEDLRTKKI